MSAKTEKLLEDIKNTESAIEASALAGAKDVSTQLYERLQLLKKELLSATQALNEGKGILKG